MGFHELLDIPVMTFWLLHKNVDRLTAEHGLQQAHIAASVAGGGESYTDLITGLRKALGTVVEIDEVAKDISEAKFDKAGFAELKNMGGSIR
jgi:hypothetical protein